MEVAGVAHKAFAYNALLGDVFVGDEVVLNTTATALELGTGGYDFVIANISRPLAASKPEPGHIVKLRYTPLQHTVYCEEERSPSAFEDFPNLNGMPVVAAGLHSHVGLVAAGIKALSPEARVSYIMTDGAALPIGFSNLVRTLLAKGLIEDTITCGQSFGGHREAVNVYSALAIAKLESKADIAIVCQGPGNVGTGTSIGFSAVEVGQIINAAHSLGGRPVAAVRMSQRDSRKRHCLISHHTLTVLSRIALVSALVPLPVMDMDDSACAETERQLRQLQLYERYEIRYFDGMPGIELLREKEMGVTSMGKGFSDDPVFFLAASSAGRAAAEMLQQNFLGNK